MQTFRNPGSRSEKDGIWIFTPLNRNNLSLLISTNHCLYCCKNNRKVIHNTFKKFKCQVVEVNFTFIGNYSWFKHFLMKTQKAPNLMTFIMFVVEDRNKKFVPAVEIWWLYKWKAKDINKQNSLILTHITNAQNQGLESVTTVYAKFITGVKIRVLRLQ